MGYPSESTRTTALHTCSNPCVPGITSSLSWSCAKREALGEEIFFRGFLGGWLIRRFGFLVGNAMRSLVFLLTHLLLLSTGLDLRPVLVVSLRAGWLLGWLRHRGGSILPGWLAHSLASAFAALEVMM